MSSSSQRQAAPAWKTLLGLLSLLLAALIWCSGLVSSLSRPSVAPSLNLQQQEISVLAEPAVPSSLAPLLQGEANPRAALRQSLEGLTAEQRSPRQEQLLSLLSGQSVALPPTRMRCSNCWIAGHEGAPRLCAVTRPSHARRCCGWG